MKLKNILCALVLTVAAAGCSLEEEIFSSAISETFIKSEKDVLSLVNGVYADFPVFGNFKSNLAYFIISAGDDIATTAAVHRTFLERTIASNSVQATTHWQSFYTIINRSNALLESLESADFLPEGFRNRIRGEMHFTRAFSYFYLVRLHGGVPIHTRSTTGNSDFYSKRNSVGEVYALILNDLKKAAENCLPFSQQTAAESGHATKGAAQAMLSLAYLTYANYHDLEGRNSDARGYYQLAKNYADSVILSNEYSLIPDYATLWDVAREANAYKEVIFAIQFTRDATAASSTSRGSDFAYYYQPGTRYHVCGNVNNGAGVGTARIQPWFYDLYNNSEEYRNDYRKEVSFVTRWKNAASTGERISYPEIRKANEVTEPYPYLNKYIDPNGYQATNNENDLFIIRLAEIYLIKAEAENELNGPTAEAYEAFNKLRERARLADGTPRATPANLAEGLTRAEFRLKIFDERGLELVGEGHRWFDAVRMRYLDTQKTMMQYRYEDFFPTLQKVAPAFNATTNSWGGGRVQPQNIVAWDPKFLIWPIPGTEMDTNPNMTQNPEW